jgi:hypothetical protein
MQRYAARIGGGSAARPADRLATACRGNAPLAFQNQILPVNKPPQRKGLALELSDPVDQRLEIFGDRFWRQVR